MMEDKDGDNMSDQENDDESESIDIDEEEDNDNDMNICSSAMVSPVSQEEVKEYDIMKECQ